MSAAIPQGGTDDRYIAYTITGVGFMIERDFGDPRRHLGGQPVPWLWPQDGAEVLESIVICNSTPEIDTEAETDRGKSARRNDQDATLSIAGVGPGDRPGRRGEKSA